MARPTGGTASADVEVNPAHDDSADDSDRTPDPARAGHGHFPDYADFLASSRAQYMGGPYDQRGAWGVFCHDVAVWALFGHGALMIDLPSGVCIGPVGINHGPLFPEKELGWLIYAGHEGQGYASEAAAALRDWAFDRLGLKTLVSYVDPRNKRSVAVAERLGAQLDADAARTDPEDLVYRYRGSGTGHA